MKLNGDLFRIESRMEGLPEGQSGFNIILNPDHLIYKAHFPGQPVTPGVCILQMLQELLSVEMDKQLFIKNIKNAKFISMMSPVTDSRVSVLFSSVTPEEGGIKAQGVVTRRDESDQLFLKFSIFLTDESF
ncbi:MAG: beta-hydroxyacyl-ACP dehydratase [Bacteroidaceae bacterium]|nr:beta-hydroxyacyl-ACP dehydratase [Bacteroidaceae bacterium]